MDRYLSAQEAAEALEISLPTLYAYVSRGLIRSEAVGGSKRQRRYNAEDVERLKNRKRQGAEKVAENALHFGTPLLDSAITLIDGGRLYYRGEDAAQLARTHSIEQVAALIWGAEGALFTPPPDLPSGWESLRVMVEPLRFIERFQVVLPLVAAQDMTAYDLRPAAVIQAGGRILKLLTWLAAEDEEDSIAGALARAWCPALTAAPALINAALILCADHELNVSSFTARCVASARATPYGAVGAGLAALQGTRHGGNTGRVEALLREMQTLADAQQVIADRLKRGEAIPGFGHPLYPDGDPRAVVLLEMLDATGCDWVLAQALIDAAERLIGEKPNIDLALVTLARALTLPADAALTLFAIGRTVGWIGHVLEQYESDQLIRPRARYVGLPPLI